MSRFPRYNLAVSVASSAAIPTVSIAVALVLWMSASPARAQPGPDVAKAQEHYLKAEKAMQAGDFKTAAAQYGAAYDITKDAVLFFKIASAHEKNNDCAQALGFYRRYLAEGAPTEEYKQMTEAHIAGCEKKTGVASPTAGGQFPTGQSSDASAAGTGAGSNTGAGDTNGANPTTTEATTGDTASETTTGDPALDDPATGDTTGDEATGDGKTGDGTGMMGATPPPNFADQKPTWQRNAAWIGVGTSLTFATIGAILGMSAASHEEDIQNLINFRYPNGQPAEYTGNARAQYDELVSEGRALATWSQVALGVAAASAVTATVFFLIDPGRDKERRAHIVPTVSSESLGVSAGWRF